MSFVVLRCSQQNADETKFPLSEDLTVGILMLSNNMMAMPFTYVGQALLASQFGKEHTDVE